MKNCAAWVILAFSILSEASVHAEFGDVLLKLIPADSADYKYFGSSVAMSGNIAIIGSTGDNVHGHASGSAYVFNVSTGTQIAKLFAENGQESDAFGAAVAISGNTAIVGAPRDDSSIPGSAYVFDVTTGEQLVELLAEDGEPFAWFGESVAIDGNRAIVGARLDDDLGEWSGSAYLFDVPTGKQIAKLLAYDGREYDSFGRSMAISGDLALVGSTGYNDSPGGVYVFDAATGSLIKKLVPNDFDMIDEYGYSVALKGNIAVVGTPWDSGICRHCGTAYIFDVSTGAQLAKLTANDTAEEDGFGADVAIGDDIVIVSTFSDRHSDLATDMAYIFDLPTGQQIAKLTLDARVLSAHGFPVAASAAKVIVGDAFDGENGKYSGSAYLFSLIPEPTTLYLATLAAAPLLLRRRR